MLTHMNACKNYILRNYKWPMTRGSLAIETSIFSMCVCVCPHVYLGKLMVGLVRLGDAKSLKIK